MHLVGFIIRIYQDARSAERQIYGISSMHPYKQSGRWQDKLGTIVQNKDSDKV